MWLCKMTQGFPSRPGGFADEHVARLVRFHVQMVLPGEIHKIGAYLFFFLGRPRNTQHFAEIFPKDSGFEGFKDFVHDHVMF